MDNKYEIDFILYSKLKCGKCEILKRELTREGCSFIESENYPSHITELPYLISSLGDEYNFVNAMNMVHKIRSAKGGT